ncbi:hypothetical protein N7474_007974 [Penicillium riverlandense]|uniref:uncharacterized protein n=1 Tax=Penicillium riverlandense TaxID=1903569 RepID=UPI002546FF4F|nr:uncharacterized protein N7474_007974 [Penicillium riverlandense]KAJ5811673.1 hypothetical protein N7474_007974 [Penicillium riverlandense]
MTTHTETTTANNLGALSAEGDTTPPGFVPGGFSRSPHQKEPLTVARMPRFSTLEDERNFRKLHHAAALRWLGKEGYNNEGAGGHVTVRDPILTDHFWINPYAKSFSRMKPEDLCLVNDQGVVVQGGNMHHINPAGFVIHSAVHRARPDVQAAVHCHSVPSKAYAAFGKKLDMISQDHCRFYNAHGVYEGFGGSALDPQEGINIAKALGNGKAVILQNHGLLAVSKTVDGAAFNFGAFDRCVQASLLAEAAGKNRGWDTIKVPHEAAEFTRKVYTDEMEYITFQSAFEDVVYESNGELTLLSGGEKWPEDH